MRFLRRRPESRPTALGPRIALWGTFDVADYRTLLLPRIFERELLARLPLARVDVYAPLGHERPIPMDGGRPAIPLGSPAVRRKRQLADRHDLVVVTGDVHAQDEHYRQLYGADVRPSEFLLDGLGPDLERRCPVVWSAVRVPFDLTDARARALEGRPHVSVQDDASRDRLLARGATAEIAVVPDPTLLAPRVFPADVLRKRIEYLRVIGCYPAEGRPTVREDGAVESEAGEVFRLPEHATVEDVTAAIAYAGAFAGSARAVAAAFDVPTDPSLAAAELAVGVDAELDTIAELAERSWSQRAERDGRAADLMQALALAEERYRALLAAHEARGERLVTERMRFAEIVDRLDASHGVLPADAALRIAELENAVFVAQAAEAELRLELDRRRESRP
jgi:hypothetical protein